MTKTTPYAEFAPALMTRELAAYYLSASLREVDYLRSRGELVAVGVGKRVKFRKDDIDAYIRSLATRATCSSPADSCPH